MPSTTLAAGLALLTWVSAAAADVTPPPKTVLKGKGAQAEIGTFMNTRWHRQAWHIEFKPIAGLPRERSLWHVAGTGMWVRLEGPAHLNEHCDLDKLDPKSVHEIVGVPVDQNYGVITFYILSPPEKVAGETPEKASQAHSPEAANPSPPNPIGKLSEQDARCLAEACRLTALINEGKWEMVEEAFGSKEGAVAILKQQATLKDWSGIGAYRGARIDREVPRELTFRFGFAPKSSPHEVWISFTGGNPSKPGLMVLGW